MTTATLESKPQSGPPAFRPSGQRSIIEDLILYARRMQASDLNVGVDGTTMEIFGDIWDVPIDMPVPAMEIKDFLTRHLSDTEFERLFGPVGVGDGALRDKQNGNVRIHGYKCVGSVRIALRMLSPTIPRFEDLNLPEKVREFTKYSDGIVLFTGKTGSGKTTALTALIDIINRTQRHHIYTLEDPIEYEHPKYPNSQISQTEIGRDVISYSEGLRGIVRAKPHIMMFAEIRDAESLDAALKASSSGHLVFSTLHTSDASETVQRIVNYFPPDQHANIRYQLGGALRAAVSLRLLKRADGKAYIPACEVMESNVAIRSMIEDPDAIKQLRNTIKSHANDGMQLLETDLTRLVKEGKVTIQAARAATNYPDQIATAGTR